VYNLGHPAIAQLFDDEVVAQEKVDGSQFSFANLGGELVMRSKGATVYEGAKDRLFQPAVETAVRLHAEGALPMGLVFRCETLCKPKHNALAYDRVPKGNLMVFDITVGEEAYLPPEDVQATADALGLEPCPLLGHPKGWTADTIAEAMGMDSVLGGQKMEGIVFKNYARFGKDGKALMGKHVSEAFRETHKGSWRDANPSRDDVQQRLVSELRTPARWAKAVQHLAEAGTLTGTPKDIGPLIVEVQRDVLEEEGEYIAAELMKHFAKNITRGVTGGLPEWYKTELMKQQFEEA
jgi:hypothetical protein